MEKEIAKNIEELDILEPNSKHFFHYTQSKNVGLIFGNRKMRMSSFEGMNDANDKRTNSFIICFCTNKVESIPMWHLYAGIRGDGVRISFTQKAINDIKSSVFFDNDGNPVNCKNILLRHVLYYENHLTSDKQYKGLYKVKIAGKVYYVSKKLLDCYMSKNPGFCKLMEWEYENEVRMIVDVEPEDYLILKEKGIFFSIEKLKRSISVRKGPNAVSWNNQIYTELIEYFNGNIQKTNVSKLEGTIAMRLCHSCEWEDFRYRRNK